MAAKKGSKAKGRKMTKPKGKGKNGRVVRSRRRSGNG